MNHALQFFRLNFPWEFPTKMSPVIHLYQEVGHHRCGTCGSHLSPDLGGVHAESGTGPRGGHGGDLSVVDRAGQFQVAERLGGFFQQEFVRVEL